MKKYFVLSVMMLVSLISMAQPAGKECPQGVCPEFNPEKMIEFRAQTIVNKIGFDDATAAKFKDIFKAYAKEVHETFSKEFDKACKKMKKECKKDSARFNMSDVDVKDAVKARYAMEKKMITIEEKYFDKFCGIMSARQAQRVMTSIKNDHKKFGQQGKGCKQGKGRKNCGHQGCKKGGQQGCQQCEHKCQMKGTPAPQFGQQGQPGFAPIPPCNGSQRGQACPMSVGKKDVKCPKTCEKAADSTVVK